MPHSARSRATTLDVRSSCSPSSGWACRSRRIATRSSAKPEIRSRAVMVMVEAALRLRETQVERFWPRQMLVAEGRERHPAAGLLDARPRQRRIEIVAAVHEHGAGLELTADGLSRIRIPRPDGGGEAEVAVVHEADRLLVGRDLHDADGR